MFDLESTTKDCQKTLDALEQVRIEGDGRVSVETVLELLSADSRAHAVRCLDCRAAVEQFAEARNLLQPLRQMQAEPGPWFVTRVMAAIEAREREEEREGVWANVRRLAPRIVAFCTLLLVLGGTWAMRVRQREVQLQQNRMEPYEALFEPGPSAPVNDDVMIGASSNGVRQ
jgi:hypothetical protein